MASRARCSCLLLFPLLFLGAGKSPAPKSPPNWFWGCWVVTKALPISAMIGLSPKREKAVLGTRITFTPTCARSGRIILNSPKYSVKVLSARDFFELGYFPLSQIGIKKQHVTEIELALPGNLSDLDFPGDEVYLRQKDIVIVVENDALLGERANPGDPACQCEAPKTKSKR